ncbi:hypothetical protein PsYK624_068960 [Phanerochaete sordida]|uniref:Uncharacterized protein n=1 Tax=Phanerochaete sordida TaxID=48140 RepID=A0A9P3G9Y1_9APHY|nr:hypothetical protein PsYK624_068960 [Phanerochaete sordida]
MENYVYRNYGNSAVPPSTPSTTAASSGGNDGAAQMSIAIVQGPLEEDGEITPTAAYTPAMTAGHSVATYAAYRHAIMHGPHIQGSPAANTHGPVPTPHSPSSLMQANPWPTAMHSGAGRRTHAHLTADELAIGLPHTALPSPVEQLLARQGGGVAADVNGTITYVAPQTTSAPQPRYAQGVVPNTGPVLAPSYPGGGGGASFDGAYRAVRHFAEAVMQTSLIMISLSVGVAEQAGGHGEQLDAPYRAARCFAEAVGHAAQILASLSLGTPDQADELREQARQALHRANIALSDFETLYAARHEALSAAAAQHVLNDYGLDGAGMPGNPYLGEDAIFYYEDDEDGQPQAGPSRRHGMDMDRDMWRGE